MRITVVEGDITRQDVDAVVNAANNAMRGGGGVDGAIHRGRRPGHPGGLRRALPRRAGHRRRRLDHGRRPPGALGDPRRRPQPARRPDRPVAAPSCYSRALEVADELGARTVAFPLVSAGVYGWPKDDAIAAPLEVFRAADTQVEEARLVAFDHATYEQIRAQLEGADEGTVRPMR